MKAEGCAGRMGQQMMGVACTRPGLHGKVYLSADDLQDFAPDDEAIRRRIDELCARTAMTVPNEAIVTDAKNALFCILYGITRWSDLFSARQLLAMLTFASTVHSASREMQSLEYDFDRLRAVCGFLGVLVDEIARFGSTNALWKVDAEAIVHMFGRQTITVSWDFCEGASLGDQGGTWSGRLEYLMAIFREALGPFVEFGFKEGIVLRGPAQRTSLPAASMDAVITDPPYYDNVPYADLSDFFYVWLRRSIGHLFSEHFATEGTPKKLEVVADATRHNGNRTEAKWAYEAMIAEAYRLLKRDGQMVVVYAHKTTLGWSTLVDAMRRAGFTVTEAWPLDTEQPSRMRAHDSAALASSIFLVARKRDGAGTGSYEDEVRPELERIVRERVEILWQMGITGADLIIAAVGAGLRAFTRFVRVEYANGEEVPAERFLTEVEGVVLETLLEKIFDAPRSGAAAVDGASRFYVLWRYTYRAADLDAGEAIVFTYGQGVELDGPRGLSSGSRALAEKKKGKYRLRDYTERGVDDHLGLTAAAGAPAPLVDVLHRILWLVEHEPHSLTKFLDKVRPDRERLRLVAQALAGAGLRGKSEEDAGVLVTTTASEQAALRKLLANWRPLIEAPVMPLYDGKGEA